MLHQAKDGGFLFVAVAYSVSIFVSIQKYTKLGRLARGSIASSLAPTMPPFPQDVVRVISCRGTGINVSTKMNNAILFSVSFSCLLIPSVH